MSDWDLDESHVLYAWPAFVDLLAAMVLVFLVLVAAVIATVGEPGVAVWRKTLLRELRESQQGNPAAFTVDDTTDALAVRIVLDAEATFPRGRFQFDSLTIDAKGALDRLAVILRDDSIMRYTAEVRVTGYTDTIPFHDAAGAFSNWELSAARASAVARYLVTVGRVDPCRVSATGRGSHFPVRGVSGEIDAGGSRRIDLWILPANRATNATLQGTCDSVGDGTLGLGPG